MNSADSQSQRPNLLTEMLPQLAVKTTNVYNHNIEYNIYTGFILAFYYLWKKGQEAQTSNYEN